MKIVMQRNFHGRDSWGTFKEQVAIDKQGKLFYRQFEEGICEHGDWSEWEGEKSALNFIFGELSLTNTLITEFKNCLLSAPELKDEHYNMKCY